MDVTLPPPLMASSLLNIGGGHLVFLIGGRISRNSIDRQRCGCQEDNEEATRCEHYGSGSSNHVALDAAKEEVLVTLDVTKVEVGCPGKVDNRDGSKEAHAWLEQLRCKKTVECAACLLGQWNGCRGT
ncbi:hypothetical protein Tco_1471391, partial [Tanacetum coccineum]